jgi:hypothetical protein
LIDVVLEADGVRIELTLKSEDGFGEVNTVVEAVEVGAAAEVVVEELEAGGVVGGVVHGDPIDDDTTVVSSMGTGLCSWSRIVCKTKLKQLKQIWISRLFGNWLNHQVQVLNLASCHQHSINNNAEEKKIVLFASSPETLKSSIITIKSASAASQKKWRAT